MPTQTATRTGGRTQQGQSRPPLRTTPKGLTYAQGRPHGVYSRNETISASRRSSASRQPAGKARNDRDLDAYNRGARASAASSRAVSRPSTASRPASSSSSPARRSGRSAQLGDFTSPEFREYQGIILAEFVLAELLVAATPIATKSTDTGSGYLSPYVGADMVKMLSLGLLYFLLELLSIGGGRMARTAAWFGGLILIVVGLNEAANIAKTLDLFAGINPKSSSKSTS